MTDERPPITRESISAEANKRIDAIRRAHDAAISALEDDLPETARMFALFDDQHTVQGFYDFVTLEKGWSFSEWNDGGWEHPDGYSSVNSQYVQNGHYPVRVRPATLFAEYFGIDEDARDAEVRRILDRLREDAITTTPETPE
jgi:hypothetical protein